MKFRSRLVVHLNHFAHNLELVRQMAPGAEVLCMVKADAYGHGMVPVSRYAVSQLGVAELGVATIDEALELRRELAGEPFDLYVFSDVQLDSAEKRDLYAKLRIIPVISTQEDLDYFLHAPEMKYVPLCLKFNTGMNRLGLEGSETPLVARKLKSHGRTSVHHLITHYANASFSMESDPRNTLLRARFEDIKTFLRDSGITIERTSTANSGAIEQGMGAKEKGDTHVRPGLMLYGATSLSRGVSDQPFLGKTVSLLETTILKVFEAKKGEPIGYNSTPCPSDGLVAILAIGYGDGFGNRYCGATVEHLGFSGKAFGRVSMDMAHVWFPPEAKGKISSSQVVTLWGARAFDLARFSDETKTIPYEIFCSLLPRISRFYRLN